MTTPSTVEQWTTRLRSLGWRDVGGVEGLGADASLWSPPGAATPQLLLVGLAGALPNALDLFGRYLDCPRVVRRVLRSLESVHVPDYCLICDEVNEFWYDREQDVCLGSAVVHAPGESDGVEMASQVRKAVWPLLSVNEDEPITLGHAVSRRPPGDLGRDLAAWLALWDNELGSALALSPSEDLRAFFSCLLLSRKAVLCSEAPSPICDAFAPLEAGDRVEAAESLLRGLRSALSELTDLFPGLLTSHSDETLALLERLCRDHSRLAVRLGEEIIMLSASKFRSDVLAAAVGAPEVEPNVWRMIASCKDADLEERLTIEGRHVPGPLRIDIDTEGLGWLVHCARWAIRRWRERIRQEKGEGARSDACGAAGATHWQLDMTLPWPVGVGPDGDIESVTLYALANSLRLKADEPASRLGGELALFAVAVEEAHGVGETLPSPLNLSAIWL